MECGLVIYAIIQVVVLKGIGDTSMKIKLLLCACSAVSAVFCMADPTVFTLKSELSGMDFDWSSGDSYVGGVAPSKGDYVTIPENMDAKLSSASESWTFVTNRIARIRPLTPTSRFVVDVPEDTVAELPCEVTIAALNTSEYRDKGNLTKVGIGELKLTASGQYSYFSTMVVSNGTLTLFEHGVLDNKGTSSLKYYFDELRVCTNALLVAVGGEGSTNCRRFSGEGRIHGPDNASLQTLSSQTLKSVFHGTFTGFTNAFLKVSSPVELWGTNTTATGYIRVQGAERDTIETGAALGIEYFAKSGEQNGSLGAKRLVQLGDNTGGGIRYLGSGGTADEFTFNVRGDAAGTFVFLDAGERGGLSVTNSICETGTKSAAMHREFILTGTGQHTNTFHCWLRERAKDDKWCPIHLVKRGSCTWRINEYWKRREEAITGGVSVENGTLQYDTIAGAGTYCALGYATNLYEAFTGTISPSRKVPWAISLGTSTGTEGTIEYTGDSDVSITDRIIALKGNGRILHNNNMMFRYGGIISDEDNAKTLTLDGAGAGVKQIKNLSDADGGAISITKKGTGAWELLPDVSFRGDLSVEEGTLHLVSSAYTWFRFVFQENYSDEEYSLSKSFKLREMAFFDAEGVSQSIGLQFADNWRELLPGQFGFAKDGDNYSSQNLNSLFGDDYDSGTVSLRKASTLDNESSWMPLVFRMPVGANAINSFDVAYDSTSSGKSRNQQPAFFYVEGSVDGNEWTRLFETNNVVSPGSGFWLINKKSYSTGDLAMARTDEKKRKHGFVFDKPAAMGIGLNGTVSVKHGATLNSYGGRLEISSFKIDMTSGGGTLNGFDFPESGTLSIVNLPDGIGTVKTASFNPVNCTGVENLSKWTLHVNGNATSRHTVNVSADGTVRLTTPAMRVIIR